MPTVGQVIRRLLPRGSNPGPGRSIASCPVWPPDLFAIAATLVEISGCYAEPRFTAGWNTKLFRFEDAYREEVEGLGTAWAEETVPPDELQRLWEELLKSDRRPITPITRPTTEDWGPHALKLLAIADTAAVGIGFALDASKPFDGQRFQSLLLEQHRELVRYQTQNKREALKLQLPYIPGSLCKMVPDDAVCVQPKTNTPRVGCTLRSFSHNLALLPPRSMVATSWLFAQSGEEEESRPLNVLLVPFPYMLRGASFASVSHPINDRNQYFSIKQEWLTKHDGNEVSVEEIADFLCKLSAAARREVGDIHAIVFPEGSLNSEFAEDLVQVLGPRMSDLELFIAGTVTSTSGGLPLNAAFTCRLHNGKVLKGWYQSKHHRWCLDNSQVGRYHLGHALHPDRNWWEQIDVENRTCVFSVVRPGASLAVLVCEDLARADPVLPVINSVGPNLVIALLMDGPQLERRWPGRYATVLADDPGSAVLTLTCLGMVRRSFMPGGQDERQIALWKQPGGDAKELQLAPRDLALALSLRTTRTEQFTFDMRSDKLMSRQFRLTAVRGVRLDASQVPIWIDFE